MSVVIPSAKYVFTLICRNILCQHLRITQHWDNWKLNNSFHISNTHAHSHTKLNLVDIKQTPIKQWISLTNFAFYFWSCNRQHTISITINPFKQKKKWIFQSISQTKMNVKKFYIRQHYYLSMSSHLFSKRLSLYFCQFISSNSKNIKKTIRTQKIEITKTIFYVLYKMWMIQFMLLKTI